MELPIIAQDSCVQLHIAPPEREENFDHSQEFPRLSSMSFEPHSLNQHSENIGASSSPINDGEVPNDENNKQPTKW